MSVNKKDAIIEVYAEAIVGEYLKSGDAAAAASASVSFNQLCRAIAESTELRLHLNDSGLPLEVRTGLIDSLFGELPESFRSVLRLLVERGELRLLTQIDQRMSGFIEDVLGVTVVDVITVVPLDDKLRQSIIERYSAELGAQVALREHIDPDIKGGVILEARGRRIDASLNAQLTRARTQLARDIIGGAI